MKTTTLFIISIFYFFNSFAQNPEEKNNDFFFRTEIDSLGICYGKSLIQAEWDTLETKRITKYESRHLTMKETYIYDTLKLDFHYLQKDNPNLKYIINYVDTISQPIQTREKYSLLVPPSPVATKDCLETVTEQYIKTASYKKWSFTKNILNSNNWKVSQTEEVYGTRTKQVIKTPDCGGFPTVETTPAEYLTVIKITPKDSTKEYQLKNIEMLCKKELIVIRKKKSIEEQIIPEESELVNLFITTNNPSTTLKKIICNPSSNLISKIQKQLFALGFYSGNFQGELNNKTKEAIIRYQMKSNLPIGQLDEETVKKILSKKTAFNL